MLTQLTGVDLYPLYPDWIRPQFMHDIRTFYIDTYHDQFFTRPPAWFSMYAWMELLYHLPLSFWAVPALLRSKDLLSYARRASFTSDARLKNATDDPKVPIQLLMYAVQTAVTTATCISDYLSWSGFSNAEKVELGKLYVPYLALCESRCARICHMVRDTADCPHVAVFMGVDMMARLNAAVDRRQVVPDKKTR